jgi:hypothetical protein
VPFEDMASDITPLSTGNMKQLISDILLSVMLPIRKTELREIYLFGQRVVNEFSSRS